MNLRRKNMQESKQEIQSNDYNEEPVYYCSNCLSLKIKTINAGEELNYCDDCGSTNIDSCNIHEWESKYKSKYGITLLNKKL